MNLKRYWKGCVLVLAVLVLLGVALYLTLSVESCGSFECFQEHMTTCRDAVYVNEEPEASWAYEIKRKVSDQCEVEVTLLSAKEGNLGLRQYEGSSMRCFYPEGFSTYPEKDLDSCTGELKENLQAVIIDNLYNYIIDNLGEIGEAVEGI